MIKTKEELYKEHLEEMFGINILENYSEQEVERVLDRLLKCLPNNGKLYKYRSMEGQAFDYAFDGLEKGYLYMAKASTLNDDMDCTLVFDPEKEVVDMANDFLEKPWLYLDNWVRANLDQLQWKNPVDIQAYITVMSCVDRESWQIDKDKAVDLFVKNGATKQQAENYIQGLLQLVEDKIAEHGEALKCPLGNLVNFNAINRENTYVFSMCEDYDSDNMWALYANNNKGFCIEYDYNKVLTLSAEIKKYLMSLYKVIYSSNLDYYSFKEMFFYFMTGKKDKEMYRQANMEMLIKTITKTSNWENEKEWRLLLCNLDYDNKIFADIVSGIIIDERVLENDNAKKLIALAKMRNWEINIRKLNRLRTKHVYEKLETEAQ